MMSKIMTAFTIVMSLSGWVAAESLSWQQELITEMHESMVQQTQQVLNHVGTELGQLPEQLRKQSNFSDQLARLEQSGCQENGCRDDTDIQIIME